LRIRAKAALQTISTGKIESEVSDFVSLVSPVGQQSRIGKATAIKPVGEKSVLDRACSLR
jgi:hypothetical protein